MAGISYKLKGLGRVQKKFKKTAKNLANPKEMLNTIALKGDQDINDHFRKESGPGGRKWKKPKHRSGQALQDKGNLRASINYKISKDSVIFFTNVKYASVHNFGKSVPDRVPKKGKYLVFKIDGKTIFTKKAKGFKMPTRKFMYISKKARKVMSKVVARFAIGEF